MTLERTAVGVQPIGAQPSLDQGFRASEAVRFLELLGKDPAQTWLRFLKPTGSGGGADQKGISTQKHQAQVQQRVVDGLNVYAVIGTADKATGKGGGVLDADITQCPALFVEWDDGAPVEEQQDRWLFLYGLPEPTVQVSTGGKSVHAYWALSEAITPERWRQITTRLIAHCKADEACKNPGRVMRLPGSVYHDKKTGQPIGQCRIITASGLRYTASEIEACLTAEEEQKLVTADAGGLRWAASYFLTQPSGAFKPRGIDEINAAAEYIPRRIGGEGTYEQDRNALCGCSAALAEAGCPSPDAAAIALLGHLWPSQEAAEQVLESATTRIAAAFWAIARDNGYRFKDTSRDKSHLSHAPTTTKGQPKPKRESKPRKLSHTRAMTCFERCVEIQSKRERNSLRRRARLLAIAKALGLANCINRQEIAQRVLEAKDTQQGHSFKALNAADRLAMKAPVVRWLIADLVPAGDLTIIGGRPKVGKTRLAVAIAAAVLNGEPFAGFGCIKEAKPVLLITDDQADGDTHQMLQQLKVWDHPLLHWSRHFRLNDRDVDAMLATIKANPGALVVVDSLRSVSRSLPAGENDPEIGAYLYDLKAAVIEAGGSLIVIHHCNKAADLVGTEALSGHNAIAGAANTVITLHHCPDANGRPDKTNTQRRLFSEGRSGAGCDLVIDAQGGCTYRRVGGFDQWQQQLSEAKRQQQASEGITPTQQQVMELLEEQPGKTFTRRQLVEDLGLDWGDGRGSDPIRVRDSLNRLAELKLISKERTGKEWTYSASHDAQKRISPISPFSPPSDTKGFQGEIKGGQDLSFLSTQSQQGVSAISADKEPPPPVTKERKERFASLQTSPSDRLQQQQGEEGEEGEPHKHHARKKRGFRAAQLAVGSGADAMDDDGDDPHWPKRQEPAA